MEVLNGTVVSNNSFFRDTMGASVNDRNISIGFDGDEVVTYQNYGSELITSWSAEPIAPFRIVHASDWPVVDALHAGPSARPVTTKPAVRRASN